MEREVTLPPTEQESRELVYAAAVLILSEDLYPRRLEVVREYIQNSSDALDDFKGVAEHVDDRADPIIKISIQGRSLLIFDNGIGMDEEEILKLKRIAYSEKRVGEEAGYKGIGRLAGIAVADKLKISSTSYGDPRLHHFEFRARDMRHEISENKKRGVQETASKVINRHTETWDTEIDPESHYTMVELRDIKESCSELLDSARLREYIGDIAPVDFAPEPEFIHGPLISRKFRENVPDYSPKTVFLSTQGGDRVRVYKPYRNEMSMAEPGFIEIPDPNQPENLLAYCWYASTGKEMLDKIRPSGRIFSVQGNLITERRRFAGLVYKLLGFSIGDRTLPQRTLWTTALPRALWFTGEIHILDKDVMPTTDRSNFVELDARNRLYSAAERIPKKLNKLAQQISDNRRTYDDACKVRKGFEDYEDRLKSGRIDRADLKTIRLDLDQSLALLRKRSEKCDDKEILGFQKDIAKAVRSVRDKLGDPKYLGRMQTVADLAAELDMPSKTRKVFQIIMDTLANHFAEDKDEYHEISAKIYTSLRKRY